MLVKVTSIEFDFDDEITEKEKQNIIDKAIDYWDATDEESLIEYIEDMYGYEVTHILCKRDYYWIIFYNMLCVSYFSDT